jgi:putative ABC transport system permease protein
VRLMTGEFARLSLLAALVGCPVAWILMQKFLQGYIYHMDLSLDIFLLTTVVIMMFSLLTVIFMVVRAATANPVNSLRSE